MNDYMLTRLARCYQDDMWCEASRRRQLALLPRRPARERLAGILVALATLLAPANQTAPARRIIKNGQPA